MRRKWLDNYFYGTVYSANYQRDNTRLTLGTAVNNYVGDHFGRVMWTKSANVLPQPDYEYYRNTGKKLDYNAYAKLTQRLSLFSPAIWTYNTVGSITPLRETMTKPGKDWTFVRTGTSSTRKPE